MDDRLSKLKSELASEAKPDVTQLLPIDGFPEYLRELIGTLHRIYGTHRDFWAGSIIAATSLAIGQSRQLVGKYRNSPLTWLMFIAPSGTGKTEPMKFAFQPFIERDLNSFQKYESDIKEWEQIKEMSQKQRKEMGYEDIPPKPMIHSYILKDATPESITEAHRVNLRGINIHRDELFGWISDFGRYNRSGEVQNWLSAWSQQPMTIHRKSSAPVMIKDPFINVTGGIQLKLLPEVAKDHRGSNGFMQRFCMIFPDDAKKPPYNDEELPEDIINNYRTYINNLFLLTGHNNPVYLSNEAKAVYRDFVNKNTDFINTEPEEYLKSMYAKLDIICLRMAMIVHYMGFGCGLEEPPNIRPESMQAAVELCEYFRSTGRKVFEIVSQQDVGVNNISVARYLVAKGASQSEVARVLKVTQPYIYKIITKQK